MALLSDGFPEPSLSIKAVERGIEELRVLDLQAVSIDELKRRTSVLLHCYGHAFPEMDPNQHVFRARKFTGLAKPSHVAELLYPPPASVKYDQRVNRAGTSIFYCCAIPECTYPEIGAEVGDHVVLSKWQFGRAPRLNHIGYTRKAFQELGSRRSCPDLNEKTASIEHPIIQRDRNDVIDAFLAEAFTVAVEQGRNDYCYKLSIAVSEIHLSGDIDGLLYPTIPMRAEADNIAFKPAYVDAHVQFISADYLLVTELGGHGTRTRLLDRCLSADSSGKLLWTGYSDKWLLEGFTSSTIFGSGVNL